jgi:hypothetical protein
MNKRVKKTIDKIMSSTADLHWKYKMLSLIKEVEANIDKLFDKKNTGELGPHCGLCSIIGVYNREQMGKDLKKIIMSEGGKWTFFRQLGEDGITYVKNGKGDFVWKPGLVEPRKEFLREIHAYIKIQIGSK